MNSEAYLNQEKSVTGGCTSDKDDEEEIDISVPFRRKRTGYSSINSGFDWLKILYPNKEE